ncbi:vWA domain-containing protein [Sedimenticola hydrogenitrophicus]|uniref:vWA domain-containing protein n=1 Tax=Sedimenticola hydrogenitrophicus TaxID=2967975 RepID=UPI0023B15C8B|nr:vWA domain-containing protein [Sedimenticola hydrogenitrophicus]
MKSKIIALSLFTATVGAIALYPVYQSNGATTPIVVQPDQSPLIDQIARKAQRIEVVFVLDTTGSMGGMIEAAKEKIWSIASSMASARSAPEIRMGLVAYRDRGDSYVTRVLDLSSDLDSMYAALMEFQAAGGGDGPESVNQALSDAVNRISWSRDDNSYKVVFLVGDAAPHMDYPDEVKYPETIVKARQRGIVINAIQCGDDRTTLDNWQRIAQLGSGSYFQVEQSGGALAIATPFDEQIARLSKKLDQTRLYYGSEEEQRAQQKKLAASEKLHAEASVASRARRATFNASKSGKENFLGDGELVDDVASGRVDITAIEREKLPASLQAMAPAEQRAVIAEKAAARQSLERQIGELAGARAAFIRERVEARGDADTSLDHQLYDTVREQAAKKGLHYDADAPAY